MTKRRLFIALLLCGVIAAGCGYTTRSLLPPHLKSVYVTHFPNKINYANEGNRSLYVPLLEVKVRNAIVDRFLFDGNLDIAKSEATADAVLEGELVNYYRSSLRFQDADRRETEEFRVHVVVSLKFWDATKEEPLWEESNFVGEATYFRTGPLATSEDDAVDAAVKDLARRVVERTIENW